MPHLAAHGHQADLRCAEFLRKPKGHLVCDTWPLADGILFALPQLLWAKVLFFLRAFERQVRQPTSHVRRFLGHALRQVHHDDDRADHGQIKYFVVMVRAACLSGPCTRQLSLGLVQFVMILGSHSRSMSCSTSPTGYESMWTSSVRQHHDVRHLNVQHGECHLA